MAGMVGRGAPSLTQAQFDATVEENVEHFNMEREEAVADAVSQFQVQGYALDQVNTRVYRAEYGVSLASGRDFRRRTPLEAPMQRPPPPSGAPPRSARHTGRARRPEATAWTAAPGTAEAAEYLAAPNGKYLGDVVNGMAHGRGKFICTNGDTYEGEYRESAQHGRGVYRSFEGDVYEGEWRDDRRHGRGRITFANGDVYDGEWRNGERDGRGRYTTQAGDMYDGEWQRDVRQGRGKFNAANDGDMYDGEWADDKMHGHGTYFSASNKSFYEGGHEAGKRHGKGTFTWANGKVFEGEWTHGEATYKGDDAPPPQTSPVKRTTKVAPGNFGATMGPGSPGTTK